MIIINDPVYPPGTIQIITVLISTPEMNDCMAQQIQRFSQEQLKSTIEYLNYSGPIFSNLSSNTSVSDDSKGSLKIIGSSAY